MWWIFASDSRGSSENVVDLRIVEQRVNVVLLVEGRHIGERCVAVVHVLVAVVEAIVGAIGYLQEVGTRHVAEWFGPGDASVDVVAPSVVAYELGDVVVLGVVALILVYGVSDVVLVCV